MNRRVLLFWIIFVAGAGLRVFNSFNQPTPDVTNCLKQYVNGEGIISEDPSFTESGQVVVVDVKSLLVSNVANSNMCAQDITLRLKTKLYPRFHYGDTIYFTGNVSAPFNFKSSTGRSFDYKGYLAKDNIFYEIKSAHITLGNDLNNSHTNKNIFDYFNLFDDWLISNLFKIKRGFVHNLNVTLGEPHSALAAGLVVGEKSALGKDLLADFRTVGLIHIVVLSGFNITVVADAMRRLLSRLPRIYGIVIGGIGIILFGILVGGGATVVRSCFMASVALIGRLIRRDYDVTRALICAGLLMLIQNPLILLHDPSFQLSFLATLGLILLATPLEKFFWFIPEKFGMRGIFSATFATQIFVSPFILYMMGQISIIGVVANILVLPFIPVTMLVVFLTGSLGFIFYPISQFFAWIAHLFLTYELYIVEHFARIPFASLSFPQFSGWWVVGFYVIFFIIYGLFRYI